MSVMYVGDDNITQAYTIIFLPQFFFQVKRKCVGVPSPPPPPPPPLYFQGWPSAQRGIFPPLKQTPWRRPCMLLMFLNQDHKSVILDIFTYTTRYSTSMGRVLLQNGLSAIFFFFFFFFFFFLSKDTVV